MATIFTVGHGTRTSEELIEILKGAGVRRLVDVRRFPGSRCNPQFSREALETTLPDKAIGYEWQGETLGGRRSRAEKSRHPALRNDSFRAYADHMDGADFITALDQLIASGSEVPTAVMCAETLWWRCHRRLIADALHLRGIDVVHLLGVGKSEPHKSTPEMRADEQNRPVYDVGVTQEIF
ncbi:MAG TPA: DUF488 domain-containing protein [Actinomycetota bacterium]|nr:DUF488 domain-containing protein [Actinomycetota bacterium]